MSKKIVIANWKMNPNSLKEAEFLLKKIVQNAKIKKSDLVICPPILYLSKLRVLSRKIFFGAQNIFFEESGAFTGEISAEMVYDLGGRYVILGHSERRNLGEDNFLINKKIKAALSASLIPILCLGEKERDAEHEYLNFIKIQILESLNNIPKNSINKLVIAYEPIWAIGKNATREATSEEFREMKIFIKKVLSDKFGAEVVENIKIIYGGSVDFKNVENFLITGEADGFLIGRNSLSFEKFLKILNNIENAKY
jgi:triosephosphate isomerase